MNNTPKQVICMRKDLGMRAGKMVSQGAHSSMAVLLNDMRNGISHEEYKPNIVNGEYTMTLTVKENSALDQWIRGLFTKVCLRVDSEEELLNIYNTAKENGLPAELITDAGLTEFHNVPTNTCVAIGPAMSEEIDKITGHLKLL
jgi:PTH2 family peptidyl-tRNA hydrolase